MQSISFMRFSTIGLLAMSLAGTQVPSVLAQPSGSASDSQIQQKLAQKLANDRVGFGTTAFNNFTLEVKDGVATVGGIAYSPTDKSSALAVAKNFRGIKNVIDKVQVAPTSPSDDRIRKAEFRAIYGTPQLNRYAQNPIKPIRITVIHGNVTLNGSVDNQADKDVANLKAKSVPGVFEVVNNLQVAGNSGR
jgi:osmotically-inducible protein OsmY